MDRLFLLVNGLSMKPPPHQRRKSGDSEHRLRLSHGQGEGRKEHKYGLIGKCCARQLRQFLLDGFRFRSEAEARSSVGTFEGEQEGEICMERNEDLK